ncbi:MAG: hypothetical protein QNJ72_26950 [Pleurocapsa sp. MO_226.B13]|nr:hypothetical protein [Pleurocapsa sp. MO_226.B13]
MTDSKLMTATLKTTFGLLLTGGVWLWSSNAVAKTVPTPKSTAQYLNGSIARNWVTWSYSVGEQPNYSGLEYTIDPSSERATETSSASYSDSVEKLRDNSSSNWEVRAASQDWLNLNRGDGLRDLVRIVLWRF